MGKVRMRRLGLKDVALQAGVSVNTASDIVNGGDVRYSPATRRRVLGIARKLGYRPHRHAQSFRSGQTGLIGLLTHPTTFGSDIVRALLVKEAVTRLGYQLLTHDSVMLQDDLRAGCLRMVDACVEGVIIAALGHKFSRVDVDMFRKANIPAVILGGWYDYDMPMVYCDVRQGVRDLTAHLLRAGHCRLVLMTGARQRWAPYNWRIDQRFAGFSDALVAQGGNIAPEVPDDSGRIRGEVLEYLPALSSSDPYRPGYVLMKKILQRARRPSAVLCANDDWAVGALAACADAGVAVPGDMALTGFDDSPISAMLTPPLTTVAQPNRAMAETAVSQLVNLIRGDMPGPVALRHALPCLLRPRLSCGAAASCSRIGMNQMRKTNIL